MTAAPQGLGADESLLSGESVPVSRRGDGSGDSRSFSGALALRLVPE